MILQKQREFFSALWGDDTRLYRAICYGTKQPNKQRWFQDTDSAIKFANELIAQNKWNVYHACSLFEKPQRLKKYAVRAKALWVDIDLDKTDCKDLSEIVTTQLPKFKGTSFHNTYWIIKTGYGLHLYWMLANPMSKQDWLLCAKKLRETCVTKGIPDDPVRTTDISSLMRFPYSTNYKAKYKKAAK